ncbi:Sec-independent protein translocase subunit TatA [Nocardiopsis tropica]|uniref:Sec-independent protein translocase protein TatA n=1 Tax=Nocardiopsis tropica TaxID=109330 RepID=A0ABU7KZL6_9ACTN|nr:Sec-independent protein translocase subunit TatA [Nocardiopsis umidischolae]MEE2054750.1 Sec-independent protein translocase subunit TatA [Nocardiopsis umidischolae]
MGPFNGPTLAILAILALLLFGAKKLPDLARSLGRSARILKAESKGLIDEDEKAEAEGAQTQQASQQQSPAAGQQYPQQPSQPQQQSYPQLPPGQRIVDESGETTRRTYGN